MPATHPSGDRTQRSSDQVHACVQTHVSDQMHVSDQTHVSDPALVIAYFFNGVETRASVVEEHLSAVFGTLAEELGVNERFEPAVSRTDLRAIRFARLQWNPESLSTLVQFHVKPSQVWCIQLALPVRLGPTSLEEALAAWREMERQLSEWLGDLVESNQSDAPTGSEEITWGSSRLYWGLSDELAGTADESMEVARAVQSMACPACPERSRGERGRSVRRRNVRSRRGCPSEPVQDAGQGIAAGSSPVRYQAYNPQPHTGDYGTLWRLDEPAAEAGPYQAAWLLLSPEAQNDAVALGYVLNGRFAVGEAYLCKAHCQAGEYAQTAYHLREDIRSVQREVMALLALEGPSGFAPDQIGQTQDGLRAYEARIHRVATAYSQLLFVLSIIDRLHLTVKTNLDNLKQMAAEFNLWDHPASRSEIARLQGVLRQIDHDQRSRRASLQGFQTAIETVRARLDLIDDGLSAARLEIEQEEARRSKRWDIVVAILGLVLGASQVVVLTGSELVIMVLLLTGVALGLALVLARRWLRRAWRWLRRTGKRR
jgi:hypothetical protein